MTPVRSLVAALALVSLQCAAAPFGLLVGDLRLGFEVPGGFTDSTPTGSPRLIELAESFTSASNRILVFALTDADMRRFNNGDPPELKQYLLAVTPRALEYQRTSPAEFETTAREGQRFLGASPVEGDFTKYLESRPPGELAYLADLRREPDAVSVLRGLRLPPAEKPGFFGSAKPSTYVLSSTTLLLLRGKMLTLTVTSGYENKSDLDAIRATTLRWIDDLRRLNASR